MCVFLWYGGHRDLHVLTHSFPPLRSSELMSDWQPSVTFDALRLRARLNAAVREFFAQRGVLEVETPVMSQAGNTEPNIASFRSEEHTSELQSLMRISYAVLCLKKNKTTGNLFSHMFTKCVPMNQTK